jgi:signal transduction histidine kinase
VRIWTTPDSIIEQPLVRQRLPAQFMRLLGPLPETARIEILRDGQFDRPANFFDARRGLPLVPDRYDLLVSIPFADGGWLNAQTQIMAEPWLGVGVDRLDGDHGDRHPPSSPSPRAGRPAAARPRRTGGRPRQGTPGRHSVEGLTRIQRHLAFNQMQERLGRFVTDPRMIAAISDLRTPHLAEAPRRTLEDARASQMMATREMQRMIRRSPSRAEATAGRHDRSLAALISTVVDDQADLSRTSPSRAARMPYRCRPTALKRAVASLLANAVQYGERAQVLAYPHRSIIAVDDDGPGIPADRIEEAFQPFVRLETSRSRETGGVGLGLSIARSIVLAHGGELRLTNRSGGGLRAEIRLPPDDMKTANRPDPAAGDLSPCPASALPFSAATMGKPPLPAATNHRRSDGLTARVVEITNSSVAAEEGTHGISATATDLRDRATLFSQHSCAG